MLQRNFPTLRRQFAENLNPSTCFNYFCIVVHENKKKFVKEHVTEGGMSLRKIYRTLRRKWRRQNGSDRGDPAIPVENSVTPNVLICLETGTRHMALRRHLAETLGLSPAEYRQRWGLPDDYPMVSTAYVNLRNKTVFQAAAQAE